METEYDDTSENSQKFKNGRFSVKLKVNEGIDNGETSKNESTPSQVGGFFYERQQNLFNYFLLWRKNK